MITLLEPFAFFCHFKGYWHRCGADVAEIHITEMLFFKLKAKCLAELLDIFKTDLMRYI